ncbi:hypothetical protein C8Q72DRAFT_836159 [Fomitopsis betulina]|nr:hypothetical protein C8Q72DRAFT_836159 [Fomitopsis betulina]
MSMMAAAASAYEEHLRRVQSTGDLPNPVPSIRPSSRGSLRRSQGVDRLQRPEPLLLPMPNRIHGPNDSLPSLDATYAAHGPDGSTIPRHSSARRQQRRAEDAPTIIDKLLMACGFSGEDAKARREFISFVWGIVFSIAQYIAIITLLAYSSHHESPTKPGLTEWDACDRPLGVWNSIWLIRVALGLLLTTWGYRREQATRMIRQRRERGEELENPRIPPLRSPRGPRSAQLWDNDEGNSTHELRNSTLYSRLSILGNFMSLAWFLTAHILEYTSVNDCRYTSPHLWWTTFGILCILYLMVLEIFLIGLLVFVFGPVLYLIWNIILLCIGRHPLQNPHQIKPEIGKLPKHTVHQIPLVLYIPPPDAEDAATASPTKSASPAHNYPPTRNPLTQKRKPKWRFAFLRRKRNYAAGETVGGEQDMMDARERKTDPERMTWEERWEPGEYPFVRLEGNRAVCAICLLDFEPPKRIDGADADANLAIEGSDENVHEVDAAGDDTGEKVELEVAEEEDDAQEDGSVHEVQVDEVTVEERQQLRLDDAGEGAVPLRLLGCGHVFHQTCVDPWLTDVSGRCPVCQRPVQESTKGKTKPTREDTVG